MANFVAVAQRFGGHRPDMILSSAGAQPAAAAMSDPFAPPSQRAGHARSYSAPGPSPPPAAAQSHNGTASAAAQPPAGGGAPVGQQQDPFAPSSSLRATNSGGAPAPAVNGSAGPPQPSAVDPFALKPQAGLSAASAAARLAATPPAQVLSSSTSMQVHSRNLAHAVLCSCIHCTSFVGVRAAAQHKIIVRLDADDEEEPERHPEAVQPAAPEHAVRRQPCTGWSVWALLVWAAQHPLILVLRNPTQTSELMQVLPACPHRICFSSLPAATAPCQDLQRPATATLQHPRRSRCKHMDQGRSVSMCRHVCKQLCAATRLVNIPTNVRCCRGTLAGLVSTLDSGRR